MSTMIKPGMSHAVGRKDIDLLETTIYSQFQKQADKFGSRNCLISHDTKTKYTYSEYVDRINGLGSGLLGLGLQAGDRVGIWMQNCTEWLETQLTCAKLGFILVNVNPDYKLPELEFALNLVECKVLLMAAGTAFLDYVSMVQEMVPELAGSKGPLASCKRVPSLKWVVVTDKIVDGMLPFPSLYKSGQQKEVPKSCLEPVNIQFTSGTTGRPKATMLTHSGILNNGYFLGSNMHYTENDIICTPVPLYHCFGCVMANMAMVAYGLTLVYPARKFDPLMTLQAIVEHGCTSLYGVPTMYIAMLEHPDFEKFKITSLRTGIMSGAPCPVDSMNRVIGDMGAKDVTICYGMTETSPVSWQTRIGTPVEIRCTTVGEVMPHTECMVVDPETMELLPCGTPGELWTTGYCVMLGYWSNEKATNESIITRDGKRWMRTGDQGVISKDGYCQIVGRIKDMICRGGENIFPKEVEDPLIAHPEITNASVIGVPDQKMGEQVCAWVSLKSGVPKTQEEQKKAEDMIRGYIQDKLTHFKLPKYYVFKDAFPMTVSGKIRKVEMRDITEAELGLGKPNSKL